MYDISIFDNNENGYLDFANIDMNNDNWLELQIYDINQNGIMDYYRWDLDGLEGWEMSGLDLNENGIFDDLESPWVAAPAPMPVVTMSNLGGFGDYLGGSVVGGTWTQTTDIDHDEVWGGDMDPFDSNCSSYGDRGCTWNQN